MSTKIYNGLLATSDNPFEVMKQIKSVVEPIFVSKFVQSFHTLEELEKSDPKRYHSEVKFCAGEEFANRGVRLSGLTLYALMKQVRQNQKVQVSTAYGRIVERLEDVLPGLDAPDPHGLTGAELYAMLTKLFHSPEHDFLGKDIFYDCVVLQAESGRILVLFYAQDQDYYEALTASGVVVPYGYWNNSDEPEEVTQEEWEQRKNDWLVLDTDTPADTGLTFSQPTIYKLYSFPEFDII